MKFRTGRTRPIADVKVSRQIQNMSLYNRDEVAPEWEPASYPMAAKAADEQERGFHERASKPIKWQPLVWDDFPADGIFGHPKEWFTSADVEFVASLEGEDLLLIHNVWFGFPDPPEWGLASRPSGQWDVKWRRWGNFAYLPVVWDVPGETPPPSE